MPTNCPNCGEPTDPGDQYCQYCGEHLGGTTGDDQWGSGDQYDQGDQWGDDQQDQWGDDSGWDQRDQPQQGGRGRQRDQSQQGGMGRQRGGGHQPRQQAGGRGQPAGGAPGGGMLPRKNAIGTLSQSLSWLVGFPVLIVAFIVVGVVNQSSELFNNIGLSFMMSIVSWLLGLVVGGVAYVYVDRTVRDQRVEFGDALSEVTGQLLSLIGVHILYSIAVGIGFVLLVVPGIYIGARLSLAYPACVLDKEGTFDSLSTSWEVADGNVLKLVGIFFTYLFAAFGLAIVLAIVLGLAAFATSGLDAVENPILFIVVSPVVGILTGMYEMAVARVYLENRHTKTPSGQQFQQQGTPRQSRRPRS